MSSFFAAMFDNQAKAEAAQRYVETLHAEQSVVLASSVVLVKDEAGEITRHGGTTPGALGAGLGAVVGGIVGLLAGPLGSAMGAVGGALSGGWFDLLRADDRKLFLDSVAQNIRASKSALLCEFVSVGDDAKRLVEAKTKELGGTIIGQDC